MKLQHRVIDYDLLARACQHYRSYGFKQIEVPWLVDEWNSLVTIPKGKRDSIFMVKDSRHLVGSAEQGFIELATNGYLDIMPDEQRLEQGRRYFSVSPCFRREAMDETHSQWFMKLELFASVDSEADAYAACKEFITTATEMCWIFAAKLPVLIETEIGYDLEVNGLEIGSYGIRNLQNVDGDHYIAYGTGLALPRFSLIIG